MAKQQEIKTARLVHANGATVVVAAEKADNLITTGVFAAADTSISTADGYGAMKVEDLKAEIDRRNDGRDEDALLSNSGKKADLIAALEADDAAGGSGEPTS